MHIKKLQKKATNTAIFYFVVSIFSILIHFIGMANLEANFFAEKPYDGYSALIISIFSAISGVVMLLGKLKLSTLHTAEMAHRANEGNNEIPDPFGQEED